jgi:RNA polymerase sigma-70 factor (ECF subfamily)
VRADLLHRLGRDTEAAAEYEAAITRTDNAAEQALLRRALASLMQ